MGFTQAGFEIAWANEIDRDACKTYRRNFSGTMLIEDDIRKVNVGDLPNIDILTAGFPCQPFSVMGYERGFKDPRGNLFFEIARVLDTKRPRYVFLENVKNLIDHDNGKTFSVVYSTLAQFGYAVKYKVINATEVNIPQNRERIFIIGFLNYEDCDRFTFPESCKLTTTINDIIDRSIKHDELYYYSESNKYYPLLDKRITDKNGIYRIDDSGVAMHKYDICPTLKANMGTYHDRVPIIRDDFGIRKLTPKECLAFQGFPDEFAFGNVPIESAYKQAGNTVCVPIIYRISKKIQLSTNRRGEN